jgi:hypothetical protein
MHFYIILWHKFWSALSLWPPQARLLESCGEVGWSSLLLLASPKNQEVFLLHPSQVLQIRTHQLWQAILISSFIAKRTIHHYLFSSCSSWGSSLATLYSPSYQTCGEVPAALPQCWPLAANFTDHVGSIVLVPLVPGGAGLVQNYWTEIVLNK